MSKGWKIALILVAVVCFAVALSYPIQYALEKKDTDEDMTRLAAIRQAGLEQADIATKVPQETVFMRDGVEEKTENVTIRTPEQMVRDPEATYDAVELTPTTRALEQIVRDPEATNDAVEFTPTTAPEQIIRDPEATYDAVEVTPPTRAPEEIVRDPENRYDVVEVTPPPTYGPAETLNGATYVTVEVTPSPTPTIAPTPTPNRRLRTKKAQPYPEKEKVVFDEADILPEYRELYEINQDMVGWITIPGTMIDYPVVQSEDSEFYLKHNFYGEKNSNGQIILDAKCDPYTPSYNLVVSGHNMKSGRMFGELVNYMYESYWKRRKTLRLDVLTERREYVAFAAFFSADYDVDEEGFRYNVDIQYELDMRKWLEEIRANQLYDTGIDVEFGDEFLTLTTCNHWQREDGRFVLVCRRIREGEEIE